MLYVGRNRPLRDWGIYMHAVEDLENTLKDIFITTESTYNQQVELENLLEEVDPRSLIRTIWENSETIYSFRTEKNREQCMVYCESELFKKWVTLLYSENGSGSPIDAQTINLWLLHDAGFLVTADFYLALDGNEYVTECRLYKVMFHMAPTEKKEAHRLFFPNTEEPSVRKDKSR